MKSHKEQDLSSEKKINKGSKYIYFHPHVHQFSIVKELTKIRTYLKMYLSLQSKTKVTCKKVLYKNA